jgi:hypothetical protein
MLVILNLFLGKTDHGVPGIKGNINFLGWSAGGRWPTFHIGYGTSTMKKG